MKQLRTVDEITAWLNEAAGLSEALLEELALTHHGYSVHLRFKLIIDRHGRVLDEPVLVTFDFDAVHTLSLVGDLTHSMVHHPEMSNWGHE